MSLVDASTSTTIRGSYYRLQSDSGLIQWVKLPYSDFSFYFQVQNCAYCASPDFRLLNADGSTYTGSTLYVDSSKNILVSTTNPFNTPLKLEAYYDPGTQGDCNGMLTPISKNIQLEVCGFEIISVVNQGSSISYHTWVRYDSNFALPLSEFTGNFSTSN
jgi:hypothetical protein